MSDLNKVSAVFADSSVIWKISSEISYSFLDFSIKPHNFIGIVRSFKILARFLDDLSIPVF